MFSGHESVVRVLLAAKANPEARNNYSHLRRQFFGGTVMPPLEGPKNDGNWEMVIPWKTKWPFWVFMLNFWGVTNLHIIPWRFGF